MHKRTGAPSAALAAAMIVTAIAVDVLLSACGGYAQMPTGPSEVQRFTVTITSAGVSPAIVRIPVCRSSACDVFMQFVNADTVPHDVRSDPHPAHTECPAYQVVGVIAPGQTKEALVSTCSLPERSGYHDETRPDNQAFWGRIER
ncbi:MAG TPA: hypothetical protein VMW48_10155 [Vicinamibacterales bacterium]|nr:hypothetical protein [Vicinamibacterales bacterium]